MGSRSSRVLRSLVLGWLALGGCAASEDDAASRREGTSDAAAPEAAAPAPTPEELLAGVSVKGELAGLAKGSVTLVLNGSERLEVASDGPFEFRGKIADGAAYGVSVVRHPAQDSNLVCDVTDGSGVADRAAPPTVRVACRRAVSCLELRRAYPDATTRDDYVVRPAGAAADVTVTCDMTTDGGGYLYKQVQNGRSTRRFDERTSCEDMGLRLVIPRTLRHASELVRRFGAASFPVVPGVHGKAAGDFSGCAMNSADATCAANWVALDGKAWFARATPFTEPNGDYTPGCWLASGAFDPAVGWAMNDLACMYETGPTYVCSDNAK